MSFVGSMFQNSRGAGYSGGEANLSVPVDTTQTDAAQKQSLAALQQQQAFANALGGGIGNQSNVFNQQQALANQLQGVANGTGPNPALAQLNQTTGANIANQSAMMAGQRGSNANVGLMARQAGMLGGGLQQQAVGQGAALQAQQQLAAMQALQSQQANMGNLSSQQVNQQGNALQGVTGNTQQQQQMLLNAINNQNSNNVNMQSNINNANAQIANTNTQGQQQAFGGLMNSLMNPSGGGGGGGGSGGGGGGGGMMSSLGGMMGSKGGMMTKSGFVRAYADGGEVDNTNEDIPVQPAPAPQAPIAQAAPQYLEQTSMPALQLPNQTPIAQSLTPIPEMDMPNKPQSFVAQTLQNPQYQDSGPVPAGDNAEGKAAMFKAGGAIPNGIKSMFMFMDQGGAVDGAALANEKEMVPGKAQVPGNSLKNDKVPAALSPGEIVIPRSIAQHPNAPAMAAEFVKKVLAKGKSHSGNFDEGGMESGQASGGMADEEATADAPQETNPTDISNVPYQERPDYQAVKPAMEPQAAQPPQNMDPGYASQMERDFNKEKGATMALGNAESSASQAAAKTIGQNLTDIKAQDAIDKQKLQDVDTQTQAFRQDVMNSKIDPQRYLGNMSTGQRIMTTIGLMLGGMGSGLAHQQNNAMTYLNNQIDRDIQSQKDNLGKKQSLLTANMQLYNNTRDAQAMTKAHMLDLAKMQLEQQAQLSNDPIVKQRALIEGSKIDLLRDQTIGPLKFRQQMMNQQMSGSGGGDPVGLVQYMVPANQQAKVTDAIGKAKYIKQNMNQMMAAYDQADKDLSMSNMKYNLNPLIDPPSIKNLKASLIPLAHDEVGRVNPETLKAFGDLLPGRAELGSTRAANRASFQQRIMDKYTEAANTAKANNLDLNRFGATRIETNPIMQTVEKIPNGQAMLQWAQKNPNDPRSQMFLKKIGAM